MATIKSYTDIEQSKKLAEILPIESADMRFCYSHTLDGRVTGHYPMIGREPSMGTTPCWSLAALLNVLPADYIAHKHYFLEISKMGDNTKPYKICYFRFREQSDGADFGRITHISFQSDNFVDACVEMIIKLHEQKHLKL
jgi:hypothetical protein